MRHIHKSRKIPASLVDAVPESAESARNDRAYSHPDVRRQLEREQYGKCAWCERKVEGAGGHVDHYRPKGAWRSMAYEAPKSPGYWWLTNEWSNLLLSCGACNSTYKRDFFPLVDESKRNIEGCDIAGEEPLLLNPAEDNPADFIGYNEHMVVVRKPSPNPRRARATISIMGLNSRQRLLRARRQALEGLRNHIAALRLAEGVIAKSGSDDKCAALKGIAEKLVIESRALIEDMTSIDAEYSTMLREAISDLNIQIM